jgi:hypothetical protein
MEFKNNGEMFEAHEKMKDNIPKGYIYLLDPYDGPVNLKIEDIKEWKMPLHAIYITMKNGKQHLSNGEDAIKAYNTLTKSTL